MSTLKTQIQADRRSAMLAKDSVKKDVLGVLLGEIDRGQLTKDDQILPVVKKMVTNIKETSAENAEYEISVLEIYLPQQLSESELTELVDKEIETNGYSSMRDMGSIMKHFQNNHTGLYDGKQLSTIVKSKLS